MADWLRLVATTINEYNRTAEVNILRNHKVYAMLLDRGQISFNHSGLNLEWRVEYKEAPVQGYEQSDTVNFAPIDRWKVATLPWRGYTATDAVGDMEKEKNKGEPAIIKIFSETNNRLMRDVTTRLSEEIYIDGNASGNEKRFHGIESFLGNAGTNTKMPVLRPDDSYAGLTTDLGDYNGTWTTTGTDTTVTDWPTGTGDSHYDYWSPLIVNYQSTITTGAAEGRVGWSASTKTWPNTCREALRFGITHMVGRNTNRTGGLDMICASNEMYRQFKDKLEANERLVVAVGQGGKKNLYGLGFGDVVNYDGVEITSEYGVPAGVAYGWSIPNVEINALTSKLVATQGPFYDEASLAHRFLAKVFANMRHNPRCFCAFKAA
jgi:hypothetical protein